MARPRAHLTRAPIAEAVLDLRVLRREGIDADHFSGLAASLGPEYGQSAPMHSIEARFGIEKGRPVGPTQVQAAVGWVYQTDGAIVQFRVDGFKRSANWNPIRAGKGYSERPTVCGGSTSK